MPYNVTESHYLAGRLFLPSAVVEAYADHEGLAECTFFEALSTDNEITRFWWCGIGSGRGEPLLEEILTKTTGAAEVVLTWEGGDSHTGYRIVDGVVTKCEVVLALETP